MTYLLQHALSQAAQRQPEKRAVVLADDVLTYGELEERSNQLAHALREAGCQRGDRVAILTERSTGSVTAIHGILKAGCAYVPLDLKAPASRVAYILRDCGVKAIVATERSLDVVRKIATHGTSTETVILVAGDAGGAEAAGSRVVSWREVAGHDGQRPPADHGIETDLAYVLYTSGSTGSPKGVMISHLNSLTFVRWAWQTLGVREEDLVSSHAPLHFDLSIFDIFVTMVAGATIFPVPASVLAFPRSVAEWIAETEISVWYSVPSVLSGLVRQGDLERHAYPHLRLILFAGEVFPVKYLRELMRKIPGAEYYNLYGPTETNVITYHRVTAPPEQDDAPIPIGRACANMEVFALTDDGEQVTRPGEVGELYARGSCLARGYWGDPDKTRSVFLPSTRWPHLGDRVYRTGDLVSLDEQGDYLYLGRRDHMIKKSGYRIELGEIEAALYRHPAVKEVAVIACPDESTGNRIEAFVALQEDGTGLSNLKGFVAEKLPKYMIPDRIEVRPGLPKTSTGKVDRQALARS